jgi:hypothetical protein
MSEVRLDRPRVVTIVGELITAGMAEHVGVGLMPRSAAMAARSTTLNVRLDCRSAYRCRVELSGSQLALIDYALVRFVGAFDPIFELAVFERHPSLNLVGSAANCAKPFWRVIDSLADLVRVVCH